MEHRTRACGEIGQLLSDRSPTSSVDWYNPCSSVEWSGVICPKPIRAIRGSCLSDSGSIFFCTPNRLNVHNRQNELDILDFILDQDDQDDDSSCQPFFCGTPPVRSSNPVIHDVAFGNLSSPPFSPGSGSFGGLHSPRVGSPCGSSSKPQIRIEGFTSANSDSGRVVSALA